MSAPTFCTFSGGPFYNGPGTVDYTLPIRVQTYGAYVGGNLFSPDDSTYLPDPSTGVISFARPQGVTITVDGRPHPSFIEPVTLVVPEDTTYDLLNIANLSVSSPPPNGGFVVINGVNNFRAATLNISGTGVTVTEDPANTLNLVITAGGGIGFSGSLSSGGMMFGDGSTLARQSAKLTLDANGRLSHSGYVASYDQFTSTYSYVSEYAIGTQAIANGNTVRQLDMIHLTGTMSGGTALSETGSADLFGINFNLVNSTGVGTSSAGGGDPARVRGIIGSITTTGSGSVRGIHMNAVGQTGSTGPVCGMALTCTPSATQGLSSCLQLDSGGSNGIAFGIIFSQSGGSYNYGIDLNNAGFNTPVYVGAPIRIPFNTYIVSRSQDGLSDVRLVGLNSSNEIEVGNQFRVNTSNPYIALGTVYSLQYVEGGTSRFRINNGVTTGEIFNVYPAPTSGNVGMMVIFNNGAAQVLKQVTTGAADSGGSGFRQLLISN